MVKIRLQRVGTKKRPFYRVVAIDHRKRRDGAVLDNLGQYQPVLVSGEQFNVDEEKVMKWLNCGAQPTDTILNLLKKQGLWKKFLSASS
ncbi:MAG: 30S ribosomal protein S16 [Spirochaetes bacterium]|nr:30S ribosomal protein S16 [Spirochaetota bacterium]